MKVSCEQCAFWTTLGVSLLVYFKTVSPSIAGGDAGELVAEGCTLGVSHPPGYPLYTILVYFATKYLRFFISNEMSDAWIVNSTSCIFGSFASAFLASSIILLLEGTRVGKSLTHRDVQPKRYKKQTFDKKEDTQLRGIDDLIHLVAGTAMGLLHSFSPLAWQYSITSEVFALHNLFVALIVNASIRFSQQQSLQYFMFGAFLCGFALTNQHTSILLSAPMILWVIWTAQLYDVKRWSISINGTSNNVMLLVAISFLSSFILLYATLPLFGTIYPHRGSWGDVTSVKGFINHFLRKDYGTLKLFSGNDSNSEGLWERIFLWASDFARNQGSPLVAGSLVVGCSHIISKERKRRNGKMQFRSKRRGGPPAAKVANSKNNLFVLDGPNVETAILASLAFYLLIFHSLANIPLNNELYFGVHQRFWMHPNFLSFIIAGLGLSQILKRISARSSRKNWITLVCITYLVLQTTIACRQGMLSNDQSDNYHFRNYARSILTSLPPNSILFINYDQQWTSIRYLQECEALRQDVTTMHLGMMSYEWWQKKRDLYPEIRFPGNHYTLGNTIKWENGGFTFSELLGENYSRSRSIFIGGKPTYSDENYDLEYKEIPYGIVDMIVRKNENTSPETFRIKSKQLWNGIIHEYAPQGLPVLLKYGEDTWEQTIVREFFDHFVSRATHLLDLAVSKNQDPHVKTLKALAEACAWLEMAHRNDDMSSKSVALWKNLGLGYMHIVRNNESIDSFPNLDELEQSQVLMKNTINDIWWDEGTVDMKTWAARRWQDAWNKFLHMDGAERDQSYESVKSIFETVTKTRFKEHA